MRSARGTPESLCLYRVKQVPGSLLIAAPWRLASRYEKPAQDAPPGEEPLMKRVGP